MSPFLPENTPRIARRNMPIQGLYRDHQEQWQYRHRKHVLYALVRYALKF